MQAILDPRRLRGYLAAANIAARQVVLDRPGPRISAPAIDPDERASAIRAILVECGAIS